LKPRVETFRDYYNSPVVWLEPKKEGKGKNTDMKNIRSNQ
jgi:hypothetical protein